MHETSSWTKGDSPRIHEPSLHVSSPLQNKPSLHVISSISVTQDKESGSHEPVSVTAFPSSQKLSSFEQSIWVLSHKYVTGLHVSVFKMSPKHESWHRSSLTSMSVITQSTAFNSSEQDHENSPHCPVIPSRNEQSSTSSD